LEHFQLEFLCGVAFLFATGYLILGMQKNERLALDWHQKALPILKEQFAFVGLEDGRKNTDFE
jgi:hypothetical protein